MTSHEALLACDPVPRLARTLEQRGILGDGPVAIARAPGRLDVMGGIADYTGSLACQMPIDVAAAVAVRVHEEPVVRCISLQRPGEVVLPLPLVQGADAPRMQKELGGGSRWARYIAGCAWWLHRRRGLDRGVTFYVDSDVPLGGGVSSSAAIEVASMMALLESLDDSMDPIDLAAACQQVENQVAGSPCGIMDQMAVCLGREGMLTVLLCQPDEKGRPARHLGELALPAGCRVAGVQCGVEHDVSGDPYTQTRVAAFMGQKILSTRFSQEITDPWLANVDEAAYTGRMRQSLPVRLCGHDFIREFGSTNDPVTRIDPDRAFHVRAATDHHVLEMGRVRRFKELLEEAIRGDADSSLRAAGRLMVESHHSYRDCARLSHPAADRLVHAVIAEGAAQGLYGARITGGGCGGTVAVLMEDSTRAEHTLRRILEVYTTETGLATNVHAGSSPGAAALGAMRLNSKVNTSGR